MSHHRDVSSVVLLAGLICSGCPGAPSSVRVEAETRAGGRRAGALVPTRTISLEGLLEPQPRHGRVTHLPPFPRFDEPAPLPRRSLRLERKMAYRRRGRKRQLIIATIAARLWRMANRMIDRVRALAAAAESAGRAPPTDLIRSLRRKISAHLRESVTLLEGVLESRHAPEIARVRLAHYLRELRPAASAKLFAELLSRERDPERRIAYSLDLAQLLIGLGRLREGLRVLGSASASHRGLRSVLLEALALAFTGSQSPPPARLAGLARLHALVRRLIRGMRAAPRSLRRSVLYHLPMLMTRLARPEVRKRTWVSALGAMASGLRGAVVARLLGKLLSEGALLSARRVLRAAARLRVPVSPPLRARVARLAGPWKRSRGLPPQVVWATHLRARLPALRRCHGHPGRPGSGWRLDLLVTRDGGVRRARAHAPAPPGTSPAKGSSAAGVADHARCLRRLAYGWRFPPWTSGGAVRLKIILRVARH